MKIKTSIIGIGHLGKIHCNLLINNKLADFIGVYDIVPSNSQKIADKFNIKNFKSIDELIEQSESVIIAAPTSAHYEIAEKCLLASRHCFIEKPVTSTVEEAKKLASVAEKNKELVIQVGHIERFNPAIKALSKYPISPLFIEAHRLSQFKPRSIDVSVVHDLMIHDIDIVLWTVNSPIKSIDANGVNVITDTIDIANVRINFENGAVANLTSSRISAKPMRKMRFFQKFGYFSVDFAKPDIDVFRLTNDINPNTISANMLGDIAELDLGKHILFEKPEIIPSNAMEDEQTAFLNSIIKKEKSVMSLEAATKALEVAGIIVKQIAQK